MKKTTTFIASILFTVFLSAQIIPGQHHSFLKSKNQKVTMSGDEALIHLLVNPNPHTSETSNSKSGINEQVIGTTTYDLQSNAAVQNRIIVHNDGTISAGWTMSQEFNTTYSDRGTGYNFFDGTSWGVNPTIRLEDSRGGWPSIIALGNGGECAITHNTDNSYINNTSRASIGTGNWVETIANNTDMIWNRSVAGGIDGNTIHMVAVTASSNFAGLPFNGLDGALVYSRSQDGGVTWDITNMQLPGMDSSMYVGMSGDVYAIAAKGETVVVAYFDDWGDSYIVKSTSNGDADTWTKTVFLDFPVTKYTPDSGFDLDNNDTTDHVFSTDNYGSLMLDDNGNAHVFYGIMQYADDDLTDDGSSWYPGTNGIAYWNESFGADNYLDSAQMQAPSFTVNGNILDSLNYSTDTVFVTSWDTINNQVIYLQSNPYQIIHFNNPIYPLLATDTTYGWMGDVNSIIFDNNGDSIGYTPYYNDSLINVNYNSYWSTFLSANNQTLQDTIGFVDASGIVTPRGRWWSDMMNDHIVAVAPDLNGDGEVSGIDSTGGYALYYASRASMPNAGLDAAGNIWLSFSAYTETADDATQVFRHLYVTKSEDGGTTWKEPKNVTPHEDWNGMQESVFGSMSKVVDDKIRIIYQRDFFPGLAVRGDEDMVDNNEIVYLEIDTIGLFENTVASIIETNDISKMDDKRIFDILGREWKEDFALLPKGVYIIDGKKFFKTK
jgi:hypothetical protein